ncbi:MAG: hypothetical protein JO291_10230 [Acidimicrobiia bacterium]|nr:hypothetical protein [Acidimicrobiia bacterium]
MDASSAEDEAALAEYASTLADGIEAAVGPWVIASVERRAGALDLTREATAAAEEARRAVGAAVRELLGLDVDAQRTTPLALVRGAVRHPTGVLARAGVPPVVRDPVATEAFPDDPYDLTPGSLADLDPDLVEVGIVWGAAKAHVILRRRRGER